MSYGEVIRAHAQRAMKLYPQKMAEVQRLAGVQIFADGDNNAKTELHVRHYLKAVGEVLGDVALVSARISLQAEARRRKLNADF